MTTRRDEEGCMHQVCITNMTKENNVEQNVETKNNMKRGQVG